MGFAHSHEAASLCLREAVGTVDGAVALGERLDDNILDAQVIEADGDRADVDDGIDG